MVGSGNAINLERSSGGSLARRRVQPRSSLSPANDVVCHNFKSDRIKGAARSSGSQKNCPLTNCSRKSRVLRWRTRSSKPDGVGCRCTGVSSLESCLARIRLLASPRFYTRSTRRLRSDLTSRFLQFGVLENQCADDYLAVPIAPVAASGSLCSPLRNNRGRTEEREAPRH